MSCVPTRVYAEDACPCGGLLRVNVGECKTSFPCQHDAWCERCGAACRVNGTGEDEDGCGPFVLHGGWPRALEAAERRRQARPAPSYEAVLAAEAARPRCDCGGYLRRDEEHNTYVCGSCRLPQVVSG